MAPRGVDPYAQQVYPQQPYPQQPYAAYPQPQYAQQPYVPQPPAYSPAPLQGAQRAAAAASMNTSGLPVANARTTGVAEELAAINREQASTVSGGVIFRNRNGEDGLSNLTDIEAPIEGRIKAGNGHVIVRATPVTLDAGTASNQPNTLARFGAGTSANLTNNQLTNDYGSQTASGVGLSLGYENHNFKGDVGTTPLGFRESNGWDDGTSGVYANAAFQYLDGRQVATNTAVKGGGGIYTRIFKDADQTLTVGANTTLMHYDKNLSYFTYGQGGYFSPQQYVILNFPAEYMGRTGLFSYDVKGSIGVQHYRQDASNYFPTDSTRQDKAAAFSLTPDAGAVYPGQSKTGVSYSLSATGEYQLAPQLAFGAAASFGNAYQCREWLAAVYVRYTLTRQTGVARPVFPPQAFSSPYLSLAE